MPKIDIRTSVMSDRRAVAARNQDIFRDRERSSAQNWKQSKSANQKIDRKKTKLHKLQNEQRQLCSSL
jgi:hypothetical protein